MLSGLRRSSITNMFFPLVVTDFALDIATPNEPTVAFLLDVPYTRLIPSTAAQQSTAVQAV